MIQAATVIDPTSPQNLGAMLIPDERLTSGAVGILLYAAIHGTWWVFKKVGAKRAKRMIDALSDTAPAPAADSNFSDPAIGRVLEKMDRMLMHQENLVKAVSIERAGALDRVEELRREGLDERTRQWERIERLTSELHSLAEGMKSAVVTFNQRHDELGRTMGRIESSQVSMATWIYQRMSGGQVPMMPTHWPQQGFPPAPGRQGGG